MSKSPRIALLYCGSRGGGLRFFDDLRHSREFKGTPVVSKFFLVPGLGPQLTLEIPKSGVFKFLRLKKRRFQRQLRNFVLSHEIDLVLFVMVSPYDYSFIRELNSIGIQTAFIFHDVRRHPGDYWPSSILLRRIMKNVQIPIFLSTFVQQQAGNPDGSIVVNFPKLQIPKELNVDEGFQFDYAILGRQKKYKGTRDFEAVIRDLSQEYFGVIQGVNTGLRNDVEILPSWLPDEHLFAVIKKSRVIICLHREASQSGIVNLAHQLSRPVIVRNVGGIPEQVDSYNGIVVRDLAEIPAAMEKMLKLNTSEIRPTSRNMSIGELKSYLESQAMRYQ